MNTTYDLPPRRRSTAAFVLLGALLLAGCGAAPAGSSGSGGTIGPDTTIAPGGGPSTQGPGGGGTAGPGTSIASTAACDVLTAENIAAIAGASIVTTVPAQQLGLFEHGCLYELRDDATSATTTINLGLVATGGRAYYDAEVAPSNAANGFNPLPGLGDVAVTTRPGGVMVLAGDALLSVQYFGPTGPDQAVAIELARQVLANLGA